MADYHVSFTPPADKALRKLPESVQERIASAARALRDNPRPRGCVKLKGEDELWRIRVGASRVRRGGLKSPPLIAQIRSMRFPFHGGVDSIVLDAIPQRT